MMKGVLISPILHNNVRVIELESNSTIFTLIAPPNVALLLLDAGFKAKAVVPCLCA